MIDIKKHSSTISFILVILILFCLIYDLFFKHSIIETKKNRKKEKKAEKKARKAEKKAEKKARKAEKKAEKKEKKAQKKAEKKAKKEGDIFAQITAFFENIF